MEIWEGSEKGHNLFADAGRVLAVSMELYCLCNSYVSIQNQVHHNQRQIPRVALSNTIPLQTEPTQTLLPRIYKERQNLPITS